MERLRSLSGPIAILSVVLATTGCSNYGNLELAEVETLLANELGLSPVVLTDSGPGQLAGTALRADGTNLFLIVSQDRKAGTLSYQLKNKDGTVVREGAFE